VDILRCLQKLQPGWCGAVFDNSYEGIQPHELETRPIPTLKELEAVWPGVQEADRASLANDAVKATLADLDMKSIRALREWLAGQPDAPQFIKDYEEQAAIERKKLL
jgi:hypothetical protein